MITDSDLEQTSIDFLSKVDSTKESFDNTVTIVQEKIDQVQASLKIRPTNTELVKVHACILKNYYLRM